MVTAEVEGMDELIAKLGRMAAKATGPQLVASLRAGALLIQTSAAVKAPVDTGTLRRSIHTNVEHISDGAVARIGVPNHSDKGEDMGYAIYQEFGTSRMAAHPYLRPAFEQQKGAAVREIARALEHMVEP